MTILISLVDKERGGEEVKAEGFKDVRHDAIARGGVLTDHGEEVHQQVDIGINKWVL